MTRFLEERHQLCRKKKVFWLFNKLSVCDDIRYYAMKQRVKGDIHCE